MMIQSYLDKINSVIAEGEFSDDWASLSFYPVARWFAESKFGIFIHWGPYSVPAFGSEWYPRNMYLEGSLEYDHHIKTYGLHKDFGYADFIPMFKAERFDPAAWLSLFRESGARYIMPVAEHHDGFQMYESELSKWNAAKMGPCRNILGELKEAAEKEGMILCASSHRAENFFFFGGGRSFDSGMDFKGYQEPYGYADSLYSMPEHHLGTHNIYSPGPPAEHLDDWLVRTCEIIDKYQPNALYFDWWIQNIAFKPYLKKLAAYYYNRSLEWGKEVVLNYKYDAFARNTAVYDIERGQLEGINPRPWQTDTAIARNSWCYTGNNDYKSAEELLTILVDVVSKNGNLLLNVGPRADGSISDEEMNVLRTMGRWLKKNGEGIYGTEPWISFAEGPNRTGSGAFTEGEIPSYCSSDIRFTYKAPYVYAFILKWPENNRVLIKSMGLNSELMKGHIKSVEILGGEMKVFHKREEVALQVIPSGPVSSDFPVCLKITID